MLGSKKQERKNLLREHSNDIHISGSKPCFKILSYINSKHEEDKYTDIIKSYSIIILIPEEDSRFTSNKYFRFLMNIIVSLSKDYVF